MSTEFSVLIPWSASSSPRRRKILQWVLSRWKYFAGTTEVIIGQPTNFSRSHARNTAAEQASHDILVFADADTAFDFDAVAQAVEKLNDPNVPWVLPYGEKEYYNLTREYSDILLDRKALLDIEDFEWEFRVKSWAGLLIVRREDFFKVGGYDERFIGWGWEDIAFRLKLDHEIGPHQRINDGRVYHLWHERPEEFNSAAELANRKLFDTEYRRKYRWRDERV